MGVSYIFETEMKFSFIKIIVLEKLFNSLLNDGALNQKLSIIISMPLINNKVVIFKTIEKEKFNFSFEAKEAI